MKMDMKINGYYSRGGKSYSVLWFSEATYKTLVTAFGVEKRFTAKYNETTRKVFVGVSEDGVKLTTHEPTRDTFARIQFNRDFGAPKSGKTPVEGRLVMDGGAKCLVFQLPEALPPAVTMNRKPKKQNAAEYVSQLRDELVSACDKNGFKMTTALGDEFIQVNRLYITVEKQVTTTQQVQI